jgi:luciferase family oxidoreductase group 1
MAKDLHSIPLSILDLAMVTEDGNPSETFANSADLARHAEKWNYTRYWLAEHHNMEGVASTATAVLIGHIAGATTSIRVGSGGIMLPNHAPLVVAEQFGTLATLYPNRIDLGLGRAPGTDGLTAAALRRDQRAVMDFSGNIRELQKYFSISNKKGPVRAIPGEGLDIPIWVLGSSTDSAYLAADMGLPYAFASHFAPAQLGEAIAIYRHHFVASSQLVSPCVMPCINVIAADSDAEAERLATSFKRLFLGILTGDRRKLAPPVNPVGFLEPHEEAALLQMTRYTFVGGKDKITKELEEFINMTKADELMVSSPIYDHVARLRSYEILSNLKSS